MLQTAIDYNNINEYHPFLITDYDNNNNLRRFYTSSQLSEHIAETPEGFLICYDVPISRTGFYLYKTNELPKQFKDSADHQGYVKIYRDEDEVFSDITIRSFEGKPVTIQHPDDFVTPENWRDFAHGSMQNVRRGEGSQKDLLLADVLLTTDKAINLIRNGLREVSCGYDAQYELIEKGKGRQISIIGNHLALVPKGRAGSRCAILDEDKNFNMEDINEMKKTEKNVARRFIKKMFPRLNVDSIRDEDLEMSEEGEEEMEGNSAVEEAKQAAQQAKEAATQAVEAAKQAAEAVEKAQSGESEEPEMDEEEEYSEEEEDPEMDEDGNEGGGSIEERLSHLESMIQNLMNLISKMKGGAEEEIEQDEDEEEEYSEEEEEIEQDEEEEYSEEEEEIEQDEEEEYSEEEEEEEIEDEEEEEIEQDEEEEYSEEEEEEIETTDSKTKKSFLKSKKKITKDKGTLWQDTIARASILAPKISISKPKGGITKKNLNSIKRKALSLGLSTKDGASVIQPILGKRKISKLSENSLDIIFRSSSELMSQKNDSQFKRYIKDRKPLLIKDLSCTNELKNMNKRNREYWAEKAHV
jgi:hypothetical protein